MKTKLIMSMRINYVYKRNYYTHKEINSLFLDALEVRIYYIHEIIIDID